jgi:hypothetical protein
VKRAGLEPGTEHAPLQPRAPGFPLPPHLAAALIPALPTPRPPPSIRRAVTAWPGGASGGGGGGRCEERIRV